MKKAKMLLIYGIIGVLCGIALTSYILSNSGTAQPYVPEVTESDSPAFVENK